MEQLDPIPSPPSSSVSEPESKRRQEGDLIPEIIETTESDFDPEVSFSMAPLTPPSAAALARLRSYACPPSVYTSMPLTRRAAVLLLLFADKHGNLRVLLTLRASQMSSYSGQVALPGGKADSLSESAFDTARREAEEEVGLPRENLPFPFRVEHLCELPAQLAITEQAVRPCVAFLHTDTFNSSREEENKEEEIQGESLIPKLNATEVAAVFSAPFHRFLSSKIEESGQESPIRYEGAWQNWHGTKWRMHNFFIPKNSMGITKTETSNESNIDRQGKSYKVWGLTARILIDSARIAYGEDPEFDFLPEIGEEKMMQRLIRRGKMSGERERGSVMPRNKREKTESASEDESSLPSKGGGGGSGTKL